MAWLQPERAGAEGRGAREAEPAIERAVIGGNAWAGISAVFKSRYLLGISTYVLLMTVIATFIYFTRLQMVAALGDDTDMRATVLAQIDLITQVTTLVLQAVVTGHLMKRLGVAVALAMLPVGRVARLHRAGRGGVVCRAGRSSTRRSAPFSAPSPGRRARRSSPSSAGKTSTSRRRSPTPSCIAAAMSSAPGPRAGSGGSAWRSSGLASLAVPLAVAWAVLGLWLGRTQQVLAAGEAPGAAREPVAPHAVGSVAHRG